MQIKLIFNIFLSFREKVIINPKNNIRSKSSMNFSYPNMIFSIYFFILAYQKFASWTKNNCLFILEILLSLESTDVSPCLTENMKDYISLLSPIWYYLAFVCWGKLNPIENFSWLIIFNHILWLNINNPCAFSNIWLYIRYTSIDPPAYLFRLLFAS